MAIKKAGLTANEEDGEILINMFPALAPLLGAVEDEEGGGASARPKVPRKTSLRHMSLDITRVKIVVQNLIKALGRKQERRLVLFVDDLQWVSGWLFFSCDLNFVAHVLQICKDLTYI